MGCPMDLIHMVGWAITDRDPEAATLLRTCADQLRDGPVQVPEANQKRAREALRRYYHGSPMRRLAVLVASGQVTREDLRILAEVVEALS